MYRTKEIIDKKIWDNFITRTSPATFLHDWQWGECNRKMNHGILRLGVYNEADSLIAVALILTVTARRGKFLFCPYGPIVTSEIDAPEVMRALTPTLRQKAQEQNCVFIRIAPLLPATLRNDDIFFELGFREAPIHMAHPELAWILDITPSEDVLLRGMRKSTRYSIKKAEKDRVTISMSTDLNDLQKFWEVYKTTVTRQHFTPFSKEYLMSEFEIFSKENKAAFFFAHYKNEITSTALIIFSGTSGFYHHGASTQKYPGLTDGQLLQWEIIKECKKRGLRSYNFWGVIPEEKKNHPWAGLSTFKRGFGGREESYTHAKDLALSPRYLLNYIVERARRIYRHL